jgi:general stress protein 26
MSDQEVSLEKKLDDLYALIDGIEIAMVTTRRDDGHLVSRPMQTQHRTSGSDLWFVTNVESEKFEELARDPHVNLAYYKSRTREWVSVSGTAILSRDRDLIDALYKPDWKIWFDDVGDGKRNGSPHDPRIALILVEADSVVYSKNDRPMPLVLFQAVKNRVTKGSADLPEPRQVSRDELDRQRPNA